ncbi:hypothetical protein [Gordonia terrae]|uniref:hypothetical protein n=1 Tax=Gordonia terrae TaxID=2055 RepID=UPI003F6B6739
MTQRLNRRAGVEDRWKKADGTPSAKAGVGSRWRARYVDESGQEHERLFARKADAQSWIDGQTASVVGGNHVAPRRAAMTFEDWAALWIAGYEANRTSTVRMARSPHQATQRRVRQMALRPIKPSTVKVWLAKLDKVEDLAPGTVRALYSRLRHILDDAVYDGYFGKNPC